MSAQHATDAVRAAEEAAEAAMQAQASAEQAATMAQQSAQMAENAQGKPNAEPNESQPSASQQNPLLTNAAQQQQAIARAALLDALSL